MSYLWLKTAHLLAMITWMAGSSYIFRLFGFHAERRESADATALLVVMERRLLRIVMLPGALLTVALGTTMLTLHPALIQERWLQLKLTTPASAQTCGSPMPPGTPLTDTELKCISDYISAVAAASGS